MARQFVDLSVQLMAGIASDPPGMRPEITYIDHQMSAEMFEQMYPGLDVARDMPDGEAMAVEMVTLNTHNGTHIDAPWHYHSTMNDGEPAARIPDLPLNWFFGNGVKFDFRDKPDGYVCSQRDIDLELERIGRDIGEGDILVVNTAAGGRYGHDDYVHRGCGFGREATLYLLGKGVRVVGTDAWSWDAPVSTVQERFANTKDASIILEGHKAGRHQAYSQIEKLNNLEQLPDFGFTVIAFPVSIAGASGAWTRAVAMFED